MKPPRSVLACVLCLIVGSLLTGCDSRVGNPWYDPADEKLLEFKKIAVFILHDDPAVRDSAEDEVALHIGGTRAIAGHTVVTDEQRKDVKALRAYLLKERFDGVIAMRGLSSAERTVDVVNVSGNTFDSAYPMGISSASPTFEKIETVVSIQTNVFSLRDGKMVWTGVTDTVRSPDLEVMVNDVARQVGAGMRKEGLID